MLSASPWIAAPLAVLVWWAATALILWRVMRADREGGDAHLWSVILGLPLLVLGIWGVQVTAGRTDPIGAYGAFLSALAVWGWIELAFLSGLVTGPSSEGAREGPGRFQRAFATVAHHEIALLAGLVAIAALTWGEANPFALYAYGVLFAARISAKLNLYLGVPRFHAHFLPSPLAHLPSHMRRAEMNWLFPVSITLITAAAAIWIEMGAEAPPGAAAGYALLATLTILAGIEHWLMVLPLPDERLWRWALPRETTQRRAATKNPTKSAPRGLTTDAP